MKSLLSGAALLTLVVGSDAGAGVRSFPHSAVAERISTPTAEIASHLYPSHVEDQAFTAKFLEIVELHRRQDPLLGGVGPSIARFSLAGTKFAFMTNETNRTVDLVFFNWNLERFEGLLHDELLASLYGSPVFVLKGVPKTSIATQGDQSDQLTNFSYVFGARHMEMQVRRSDPTAEVPEMFKNWKPHPGYMDGAHPLRQTLDTHTLVLLSPSKDLLLKQWGLTEDQRHLLEQTFQMDGAFYNFIMGMMVHEAFHVREGEDQVNGLAVGRPDYTPRDELVKQLAVEGSELRVLIQSYIRIVFNIGDTLKRTGSKNAPLDLLQDLRVVVAEIKGKYPDAWSFIWNYEYTEGFAEYVSAYSMIQVGVTSRERQIDLQKADNANNFAYRTGALGGLYLAYRLREMPFKNREDHVKSVWELILDRTPQAGPSQPISSILERYKSYPLQDDEISRVIKYLVSTQVDLSDQ